jgi:3-methyladenine DNA glycosylase/8-oxoguanine DNA glycosylase
MTWFDDIVTSHGWYQLAPFTYDPEAQVLHRVHQIGEDAPFVLSIFAQGDTLAWRTDRDVSAHVATIQADVERMFCWHWRLDDLYAAIQHQPRYASLIARRWGRLLVAPTVWEDLAKTLFTTNTTWAQTRQMSARLCALGSPHQDQHAFPTPQRIAHMPLNEFIEAIRAGYRAAYLHELAQRIVDGLDVEAWRTLDSETLYKHVRSLKGFGDYAAGTMVRMLGHFDRLAIDTECRASYRRLTGLTTFTDNDIRAHYAQYGVYQGLVMWMDMVQ